MSRAEEKALERFEYASSGVYCNDSNDIVLTFIKAAINMNDRFSSSLAFTFPKARIFEKYIFMGYSIVDLHYSEHDATIVDSFKLFILHFMINLNLPDGTRITKNFESQLRTLLTLATYECKDLEYVLFSRDREIEEQRKITLTALPFLGAIFAVLSPAMTLVTSCGILWNIGLPFSNILIVVLFLIIIIGVDDSFFILAAWRHSKVLNPKISSMDCDQKLYGMTRTNYILLILAFQYITLTNRCRRKYRRKYQERVISYLGTEVNTDFDIENLYLENLTMNAISRQLQHFNLSEAFVSILVFIQCQILLMFLFGINLIVWLKKLETIPKFGMGSNETVLWTRDFANAIAFWDDESNFWQQDKLLSTFREYEIDEKFVITERFIISKYAQFFNINSHHPLEKVPTESAASEAINFVQTAFIPSGRRKDFLFTDPESLTVDRLFTTGTLLNNVPKTL
ncbi:Serine/threonine-protein phosphatase [Dirofilaria immitis]|nr:Serine/threonine-protein phosphatase [Dirofilaria immitis]